MKLFLIPLLALPLLAACHRTYDEANLRENAMGYLEATSNYDLDRAARYATPETDRITLNFLKNNILPSISEESKQKNLPAELTIDSVVYRSDTSAIVHFRKKTPRINVADKLPMRLRKNGWKAHMVLKVEEGPMPNKLPFTPKGMAPKADSSAI